MGKFKLDLIVEVMDYVVESSFGLVEVCFWVCLIIELM